MRTTRLFQSVASQFAWESSRIEFRASASTGMKKSRGLERRCVARGREAAMRAFTAFSVEQRVRAVPERLRHAQQRYKRAGDPDELEIAPSEDESVQIKLSNKSYQISDVHIAWTRNRRRSEAQEQTAGATLPEMSRNTIASSQRALNWLGDISRRIE